jgi:hypothetical protein
MAANAANALIKKGMVMYRGRRAGECPDQEGSETGATFLS